MAIVKTKTRRELRETFFERGKHRPLIIEIENGIVYALLKGQRHTSRRQISIEGALQHAIRVEVANKR